MGKNQMNEETEIDLVEIFYLLRAKLVVIILCTLLAGIGVGSVSKLCLEPVYASTTKLYILTKTTSITSLADIQAGTSLTQDYMELVKSRPVVEGVIKNLGLPDTYEELLDKLSIDNPTNTRILSITVKDHDARMAKEIVDEFAEVSSERISSIMATDRPNVAEKGHVEKQPVEPSIPKNTVLGALFGLLISCGVVIVQYLLDDTLKSAEDIEKYLGLNTLALIPAGKTEYDGEKRKRLGRKGKGK